MKTDKKVIRLIKRLTRKRESEPTEIFDFRIYYKRSPFEIYTILRLIGMCHLDAYTAVNVLWDYVNLYGRLSSEYNLDALELLEINRKEKERWKERGKLYLNRG